MLAVEFVWDICDNDRYSTSSQIDVEPASQLNVGMSFRLAVTFRREGGPDDDVRYPMPNPAEYTHICHPHCLAQFISPHLCFCNFLEGVESISESLSSDGKQQ